MCVRPRPDPNPHLKRRRPPPEGRPLLATEKREPEQAIGESKAPVQRDPRRQTALTHRLVLLALTTPDGFDSDQVPADAGSSDLPKERISARPVVSLSRLIPSNGTLRPQHPLPPAGVVSIWMCASEKIPVRRAASSTYQPTLHGPFAKLRISFFCRYGGATMPGVKQASKRKRMTKAVPALGAAGLTFSLVGSASAAVGPAIDESLTLNYSPNHQLTLGEEEIADISLATFYVFDKEGLEAARNVKMAWVRGCGCRACRACRAWGCRACGCGGCGGGGCCASWGACRWC